MPSEQIPKIILDPENEAQMLTQAYLRARASSGNTLTDFSPGSTLRAVLEGTVYPVAELLWYLNKLPEASAIEVLRLAGVTRSSGTYSTGTLTVLLNNPLGTVFFLPTGYLLPFNGTQFRLEADLVIPSGSLEGDVRVSSIAVGSAYNYPAYKVNITGSGLNYVNNIYNKEAITGGSDLEDLEDTIARAQVALRSRDVLVSATDYEIAAQTLLGDNAKATCIPLLASDRETEAPGNVHVFMIGDGLVLPSTATCQSIQSALQANTFAAARVWVSPVALYPLDIETVIEVDQISQDLAIAVQTAIERYLNPHRYSLGATLRLRELDYVIRSTRGVLAVTDTLVNRLAVNIHLPHRYSLPNLEQLAVTMVDGNRQSLTVYRGTGIGVPD